ERGPELRRGATFIPERVRSSSTGSHIAVSRLSSVRHPLLSANHFAAIRSIRSESDGRGAFGKGLARDFLHNRSASLTHRHPRSSRACISSGLFEHAGVEQTV